MSGYNVCQKNFALLLQHSALCLCGPNAVRQKPCFDFVEYSLQENKYRFTKQPDVHLKPVSWWMGHCLETQDVWIPLLILSLSALTVQAWTTADWRLMRWEAPRCMFLCIVR